MAIDPYAEPEGLVSRVALQILPGTPGSHGPGTPGSHDRPPGASVASPGRSGVQDSPHSPGPAPLGSPGTGTPLAKIPPDDANYHPSAGTYPFVCGTCCYMVPMSPACQIVDGPIDPEASCRLWTPIAARPGVTTWHPPAPKAPQGSDLEIHGAMGEPSIDLSPTSASHDPYPSGSVGPGKPDNAPSAPPPLPPHHRPHFPMPGEDTGSEDGGDGN